MIFVQLLLNFLYFLRFSEGFRQNKPLIVLSAIFPQVSFNFGISAIAFKNDQFPMELDYTYYDSLT